MISFSRVIILALFVATFVTAIGRYNPYGENNYKQQQQNNNNENNQQQDNQETIGKHSFHSPFLFGASSSIPNWEYGGSAVATENFVRLVPAIRSRVGYIWNTEPVDLTDWQVEVEFNIHNTYSPGADGLAFWYAKDSLKTGPLFGNIEEFDGLGIIFDTYDNNANGDNPAIVGIMGHGHHVNWDYDNDLKANQLDRCRADFRNALSGIVKARIQYKNKVLNVWIDTVGSGEFTKCFTVNNVFLPKGYYFGLSAATGGLADYHDVYGFTTKDVSGSGSASVQTEETEETAQQHHKKHGWYDPYEYYHKQIKEEEEKRKQETDTNQNNQQQAASNAMNTQNVENNQHKNIPDQPPTFGMADEEEHQFFENLREKLKHFGFDENESSDATSKSGSGVTAPPSEENFSTQTGLLILEALEEVARTVKSSSTKNDINSIIERVQQVSSKQSQVQQSMKEMKEHLSVEVHSMLDELKTETNHLSREIRRLDSMLNGVNSQVDELNMKHTVLNREMESSLPKVKEDIRSQSSYGFWIFFVLFQIVFIVAGVYYQKYRTVKIQKFY